MPEEQRTPELAALGRHVSFEPPQPKTTHVHIRKARFRPLQGPLHDRVREMAGRVVNWMQIFGGCSHSGVRICTQRTLARGLHAARFPAEWVAALSLLAQRGSITVVGSTVTLTDPLANLTLPSPYPIEPEPRKRRKRPLSEWVKNKIRERGGTVPES